MTPIKLTADSQVVRIPGVDAVRVNIDHAHFVLGTVFGDDRHGGPADIAGADALDITQSDNPCWRNRPNLMIK